MGSGGSSVCANLPGLELPINTWIPWSKQEWILGTFIHLWPEEVRTSIPWVHRGKPRLRG